MNKRSAIKLTSITLVASVAVGLWASAVAGPNNGNKGPKASIALQAVCTVDAFDPSAAMLNVETLITDTSSSGGVTAVITNSSAQAVQGAGNNKGGNKFQPIGDSQSGPTLIGAKETISFDLCAAGLSAEANSANVMISVDIVGGHKTFTAMCGDDPMTTDVTESGVSIGHLGLCP